MKREDIIRDKGYWLAKIQISLYQQIQKYMDNHGLNRSQLAKRLGVSKGYVSQVLNGDFNHRLSTLVELSLSVGKIPEINFIDLDKQVYDENTGFRSVSWTVKIQESKNVDYMETKSTPDENNAHFNETADINPLVVNFS
jgi:transcriptional regulator with XRE-family HTH domain